MNDEIIRKLLTSPNIDDVSLGITYLYNKLEDSNEDLWRGKVSSYLSSIIARVTADFYIGCVNILAVNYHRFAIYSSKASESDTKPVIRL